MKKKILGIVGIRSKSTGLKNKNIKFFGNKPLVAWILRAAKKSKYINRLIVSTDSHVYAKIAKKYGAEVPFLRPKKISTKYSDEIEFIKHALSFLKKNEDYQPDIIVRLLATVPFQKTSEIDKVINLIVKKKYDSSVIISKAKQHPRKALKIIGNKKKYLVSYISKKGVDIGRKNNRLINEKNEKVFFRSNVIACKLQVLKKNDSLCNNKTGYVLISNKNNIDIDSEDDFNFAKYILGKKNAR